MTNTNDEQIRKFKDVAKQIGCDEDEAAFEGKLRRIAEAKPAKPAEGKDSKAPE